MCIHDAARDQMDARGINLELRDENRNTCELSRVVHMQCLVDSAVLIDQRRLLWLGNCPIGTLVEPFSYAMTPTCRGWRIVRLDSWSMENESELLTINRRWVLFTWAYLAVVYSS